MRIHYRFHITQSKPEPLHVVNIPGMRTIELFEDAFHGLLTHANTVIFYPDAYRFVVTVSCNAHQHFFIRILHRIIHQVINQVGKVYFIRMNDIRFLRSGAGQYCRPFQLPAV